MIHSGVHQVIDAVWRIESARIVAGVARLVRDIGLAEELAQDALVAALKRQLPLYMVPRQVVVRAEIPRSPNGKFDRNALRQELIAK